MDENFKHAFKEVEQPPLGLVVHHVGFQKCMANHQWGPGVRDHYLIHYVLSGKGTLQVGDRTFVLEGGQAFLLRPDTPASYCADGDNPWEYYWVGFSGPVAPLFLTQTGFAHQPVVVVPGGDRVRQALLDIYKARGSDYPSAVTMAGYLQVALGLLMEGATPEGEESVTVYAQQGAEFIHQNYSHPITVEEVARHVGVSRSYLYRAFHTNFQQSPSQYLIGYRIQRACQLLKGSKLSVQVVATSVGFEDHFYFSRAFRREMGVTPTEYRKNG